MSIFHPLLLQARELLKPLANMKNAMSVTQAMTGIMNRTGLPAALRRTVQGWGLGILGIIVGVALLFSLLARMRRDSFDVRQYWKGRNRWIAAILALALGIIGAHLIYMRKYVTGILQLLGTVPFLGGAMLLSEAKMMDFIALSDNVVGGLILFVIGLVFVVWRLLDLFMILFGGLTPRKRKLPKPEKAQAA